MPYEATTKTTTVDNGLVLEQQQATDTSKTPVYEVVAGVPTWSRLYRLATEATAQLATTSVRTAKKEQDKGHLASTLSRIRHYLTSELPPSIIRDVLNICLERDRFGCHHNPTDCLSLDLWQVFYTDKCSDINVGHHAFAFPKSTNYPDIVQGLQRLLLLVSQGHKETETDNLPTTTTTATTTSFKLELKQCEVGGLVQDQVSACVSNLGPRLKVLELPGLASDELLNVIALTCTNLEVLNVKGSREQVTDPGFTSYVETARHHRHKLTRLDVSRCSLSHVSLPQLQLLTGLVVLKVSTLILEDCDNTGGAATPVLDGLENVTVEHENSVQISINNIMAHTRALFPRAKHVALINCVACELHVTLTQQPTNLTFMRQHIHTLELISADYFHFPRLVYPCPNLESLHIEKPSNDVFNIDAQNVPFLYGNTVPFSNLKNLKLSRISLTNLTHFLSKSSNLRQFKVTNIGRRERPRWTDERIQQILPPHSVPNLRDFHVSCLPNEGYSTVESHRYLHLTKATVLYLTDNFRHLKRIAGIESWTPRDTNKEALNALLNCDRLSGKFAVISI